MMRTHVGWTTLAIVAGFVAVACSDDDSAASVPDASTGTGGREGGAGGASSGAPGSGGSSGSDAGPDAAGDAGPDVSGLIWAANPRSVLAGSLEFDTSVPTTVAVVVTAGMSTLTVPASAEARTAHSVRVLGLHPSTRYTASVTARDAQGNATTRQVEFETGALPADFPPIEVSTPGASRMQPGWTLFPVFRWNPALDAEWGYLIAVDAAGTPVWYQSAKRPGDVRVLASGNLLYNEGDDAAVEIDPSGAEVQRWTGAGLGIDTIHHEIFAMPGGTFATLGTELRNISGYPSGAFDVVGDLAVEFERDGTVVHNYSLLDRLEPLRTRPGFDAPFWDAHYGKPTKDWSHGNAIIHDPSDDSFILSLRHQDYLVKLDRKTGAVIWRFGEGGDVALDGGGFPYHAHAPEIGTDGHLFVYDNGNGRPNATPPFTRVVEYELGAALADAGAGDAGARRFTARVVWEYRGETPYFAQFVGDVDQLGNGNILVSDGGLVADPSLVLNDPGNLKFARIVEVTHAASPELVFQLDVHDKAENGAVSYSIYRAERIAPLK